jgi:LmbE family N-acetylglucosaminyl deacetylase
MTITNFADLGRVLGVWGHPDDEAYLSGGIMAAAADAGQQVVCVTATRGEAGFPDDDPRSVDERIAVRETEMRACLDLLGVTDHRWLSHRDGACDQAALGPAVQTVCDLLAEVEPDTVLTFGPDGQTGHVDHIAVGRWTTLAFRRWAPQNARLLYATMTPAFVAEFMAATDMDQIMMVEGMQPETTPESDLAAWIQLDDALLDRKVSALRAQASQVEPLVRQVGVERFRSLNRDETFRPATAADWVD